MTEESKWIKVEERKHHSILLMPFRFVSWLILWAVVMAVLHVNSTAAAWIALILAVVFTFSPKIVTRRYRIKQ